MPGYSGLIGHKNWLGSTRFISNRSTRALWGDYSYAPFGESSYTNGSASGLNFTGQTQDTTTGVYDFQYREYSPVQGRWVSPDPAGLQAVDFTNPQSWNRYAYVWNNPLSHTDQAGLFCVWDNGSYDSADDPDTGTASNCGAAGGNWFDGSPSDWGLSADWSNQPNPDLQSIVGQTGDYTFNTSGVAYAPTDPLAVQASMENYLIGGIESSICSTLPQGRTFGISGSVGGVGGQTGSVEIVINYNTGEMSGFASGGLLAGWNGVAQASVSSGFIYGALNGDNSGYSGGFSAFQGGDGPGFFRASSSGGLTGGVSGMIPDGNVTAAGASFGVSAIPLPTGGFSVTNYTKPLSLGRSRALWSPIDYLFYWARRGC